MKNAETMINNVKQAVGYTACYVQPSFSFFNADNMDVMKTFADKEFDLAIIDPPYGIKAARNPTLGYRKGQNILTKHKKKSWDDNIPTKEYFKELFRISKNQIIFGGNYFAHLLPPSMGWICYDKMFEADLSFSDFELAWTSYKQAAKKIRLSYKLTKNNVTNAKAYRPNSKIHPTQKHVDLYDWIITNYAKSNDKIIDTHLGSGSIAIAVDKANVLDKKNLSFVGIELESDYYQAAIDRFVLHKRQGVLF